MTETTSKKYLPSSSLMPSPSRDEPVSAPQSTPQPSPKPRPIPRKIVEATEVLLDGRAKNLTEAAKLVGCSQPYLSQTLTKRPDAVQYMQRRAARVLGIASTVAAARMAALIYSESEHVSFRASEHVLSVSGIQPPRDPQVQVAVSVRSGFLIDLRERDDGSALPNIDPDSAGAVLVDAEPIDAKPIEPKPTDD